MAEMVCDGDWLVVTRRPYLVNGKHYCDERPKQIIIPMSFNFDFKSEKQKTKT